ncbi:TauD/TfdA family dioxygenase [Fulvivirgaceae bacterium BMA12]|uniref:TauD/TfdA family dioxygenase n=1 Tax=Agaribacillus aureus TaxID=3051825 RepID=A0ABT8LJ40_9BACT|nr:TauD/TfdA family dioxygenase [Fulvivirgaceae bacterium BMA12]
MKSELSKVIIGKNELPVTFSFEPENDPDSFIEWFSENRDFVENKLLEVGAIYFKGTQINTIEDFDKVMKFLTPNAPSFLDGNSPRTKHTSKVYNASEYDASAAIHLHTEYSYSKIWPLKIYFCCIKPAASGGETTVADCRVVLKEIDPDVVDEFQKKGISYIRNLHSGQGFGPSWQEAFETNDKHFMEKYCKENGIQVFWQKDGSVRLIQDRPAIRNHPVTGERLWFNQVDQFYPLVYGEEMYQVLMMMSDNDVDALPMYSRYGDGSEIQKESIDEIMRVLTKEAIPVPWQRGNLLMVDNMLALHGRLPYSGERKILAAMG